ncbi:MAG: hypothetical protein HQM09_24825, partial [Candidatus Riflebacteria bacterium]|nr:hypothetical protein [Candidatus Riflebacteria bacterium]
MNIRPELKLDMFYRSLAVVVRVYKYGYRNRSPESITLFRDNLEAKCDIEKKMLERAIPESMVKEALDQIRISTDPLNPIAEIYAAAWKFYKKYRDQIREIFSVSAISESDCV